MKKIELRKVALSKTLSEETPAYTAQVWVDGVRFCDVSNHGHGGCDMQYPAKGKTHADIDALNAEIKATYPKESYDFGAGQRGEYELDLEALCHKLLDRWEIEKDVKRDLRNKIMFVKPDGKLYQVKLPADRAQTPKLVEMIKQKHGIAKVLNELPFEDAVAAYERSAVLP